MQVAKFLVHVKVIDSNYRGVDSSTYKSQPSIIIALIFGGFNVNFFTGYIVRTRTRINFYFEQSEAYPFS